MKPAGNWRQELASVTVPKDIELVKGARGEPSLRIGKVYLHSRYRPREEAARLIDSAKLDLSRPVLVVGVGLGYHVAELADRGATVAVVERNRAVAKLAVEGVLGEDILLGVGEPDEIAKTEAFRTFAGRTPQLLIHPPSARVCPEFAEAIAPLLSRCTLRGQRLGVAVVGPMYGGSLPIAEYLTQAFQKLGHRALLVDNSEGWPLYQGVAASVKGAKARGQLTSVLTSFLGEWSYARVMEFQPDVCIVLAQAPVGREFPARLAKEGVVSAFWYVENWRHLPYWREIAPFYDYFFHIQPGEFDAKLAEAGCLRHAAVQTGCDPDVHKPVELNEEERSEYGCDVSFAGAGYFNRNQVFSGLTDYDLKLWGVEWSARVLAPFVRRPDERFTPEQFIRIVAGTKVNVNLHSSAFHPGVDPGCDAVNPRVFEIAACGGFQVCDPCQGLENFFDFEHELPVYQDLEELRRLIDFYLAHPEERSQVAEQARTRALKDHTYETRAQQMLDLIIEAYGSRILKKGIRVQRTVGEVAERVGQDTPLGAYLASLPQDMVFTQEAINEHIPLLGKALSYPEAVFAYLRDMRSSAESLLAMDI
jgi:spore maturation protein CgeB